VVLDVQTVHSDHLLDRLPLLDGGGFLLYNINIRHPFFMEITVYTSEGCFYCTQIKELLKRADLVYDEIRVNNKNRAEFMGKFPTAKGYPFTIIDETEYPSLIDVAKFLVKEGLVSAKKG